MKEHSKDKANRLRCQKFARSKAGRALAKSLISESALWRLVLTYPDADAQDRLAILRERFWANEKIP